MRKTILRSVCALAVVLCLVALMPRPKPLYAAVKPETVLFYTSASPEQNTRCSVTNTGTYYEVRLAAADIADALKRLPPYDYCTVTLKGSASRIIAALDVRQCARVLVAGGTLYSGYSPYLAKNTAERANIQIFEKDGKLTIGSPYIYGSY